MIISIIRTMILYVVIIVGLRLLGKRQIGEFEPSELVVAILISELAAIPIQDIGTPILSGVLPIVTLICLELIVSAILIKSLRFRKILCGKASIVIRNGVINQKELRRNRLTTDELIEELRLKDVTDISTIKCAIIESNGQLSVLLRSELRNATAEDLAKTPVEPGLPVIIINDGRILSNNMKILGLNENWLQKKLESEGIDSPRNVFLMLVDEIGRIYIAPQEKQK